AVENERMGECTGETLLSAVQMRATRFLETCCILDGVRGLEDRIDKELKEPSEVATRKESTSAPQTSESFKDISKDVRDVKSPSMFASAQPQTVVPPELVPRTEPEPYTQNPADLETEGENSKGRPGTTPADAPENSHKSEA